MEDKDVYNRTNYIFNPDFVWVDKEPEPYIPVYEGEEDFDTYNNETMEGEV